VTVVATPGPKGTPRVGFVAGKKVGSSVQRNRAKRRLRAAAAQSRLESDTVYVLIADRGVLDAQFTRLVGWINHCVEKTSLTGETE
jgi:ribonuclease P protein component